MAEDPDAIPSMQLAWEMIELARVIYKQRDEVSTNQPVGKDFESFERRYLSNYIKPIFSK